MAAKSRTEKPTRDRWKYAKFALLLASIAGFLGGLIWAGRWGLDQLRGHDRYHVPFAEIECEPPVGMDRRQFLDEVRYPRQLPPRVHLLDEDLPQLLRAEFARHAWVAQVDEVVITPPKRIVVKLTHRVPVLAVPLDGGLRAVDGTGVLLPRNAPTLGLPIYPDAARPPSAGDGMRWGDPNVEAAARNLRK